MKKERIIKKVVALGVCLMMVLTMTTGVLASSYKNASGWAIVELERADNDGFITDTIRQDFSKNITREEFCEIAVIMYDRLGGKQNLETYNPFTDTTNPQVVKAFNAGIINGVGNNLFAPDDNLTREQLCVMIVRAMVAAGIVLGEEDAYSYQKTYQDQNSISSWATLHVLIMNDMKIMNGTGDMLEPGGSLTREQAVIMLERTYLRDFTIKDNVLITYLGNAADVLIPSGVIEIGEDVFHDSTIVTSVTLPSSITKIGYSSFKNMANFETITLNEGLTTIGEAAFELSEKLQNVTLPSTLESIEFMAFQDCLSFTEITIPSGVSLIDDQAFYRCENLKKVTFEGDVETIGETAFELVTDVVFVCEEGSNVDTYAQANGITVQYK